MTTLMSDDGTGKSNGTVWDTAKWTSEGTSTGGTATYQSSALQIQSGAAGGYSGAARITRSANITAVADVDITGTFVIDANEPYGQVCVRATTSTVDYNNGYALVLNKNGTLYIDKIVSFSGTHLATQTKTLVAGTTYGFRMQAQGTTIRARTWVGTEPGTWDLSTTDSTFTAAGKTGITVGAGNAATNHRFTFDDIVVTDFSGTVSVAETVTTTDAASVQATLPTLTETSTATDAFSVAQLLATVTEAAHATDGTLAMTAAVPLSESAHAADAISVGNQLGTVTETVTTTEAISIIPNLGTQYEITTVDDNLSVTVFQLRHDVVAEIEFTDGEWTDVSEWLSAEEESTGTFGRPTRYDDVAASTWDMTLRNSDGRFTPGNPNSPYYPNVAKGKNLRVSVTYSGQSYPRFWGQIAGITMPAIVSVDDAIVHIQAADIMATLARKTLLSPFVEESRRQARANTGGGVDVFPFPASSVKSDGSIQVADTSFENKGILFPSSTRLGTISIMASGNGAGAVKSASVDSDGGVLSEGQLDFEVGDNGSGKQAHPIIVCKPQVGWQQFELFFKVPENVLPPRYITGTHTVTSGQNWNTIPPLYGMTTQELAELNPDAYPNALAVGQVLNISNSTATSEWILADLWAGSTEVLRIVLGNQSGKLVIAATKPTGGSQYIYNTVTLADNKWRKLTIYKDAANSFRANINDAPSGSAMTGLAADLTAIDTVYITGRHSPSTSTGQQVQCPPCSIGGVAFQKTRNGVWYYYTLGAPPANITARDRFLELAQYGYPIQFSTNVFWHASLNLPFDAKVVRTNTTGRTVLECMQELARTMGAYLWVQPQDGVLTMRKGPTPASNLATIDLDTDADIDNPPQWKDTVDTQPTRVTAKCPAGEVTSINTAAEAAGQYKDATIDTCAPTIAVARGVADRYVSGQSTLHLTNLQVDMVHAGSSLWPLLLPVFLPSERVLHVTSIPEAVIGFATIDAAVEAWTEAYTIDSAKMTFQTTPVGSSTSTPPLASFTVTSSSGVQANGITTAPLPNGTTAGDLLMGIMTVDNTGTLAGMSAPDSAWTVQGAGGTGNSGFGNVWTKTAGASEPTSYSFNVVGTTGTSVLVSDSFTGTDGAAINSTNWAAGETRTGAAKTIQSNTCLLNPGTGTGYTGRVSIKANIADKTDVDLVVSFKFLDGDSFFYAMLRGDSGSLGQNGYEFRPQVGSAGLRVASVSGYTATELGRIANTMVAGTWYRMRCQVVGSHVRCRTWPAASAEPSSWTVDVTNTVWTAAGTVNVTAAGGNLATSRINIDDAVVSDPNAISAWPEAKLTLLRIAGADATSPILTTPVWTTDNAATTSHDASSLTPASTGLLVDHWHMLTAGSGSGGGGGGSPSAFSFGTSGLDSAADITAMNTWLTNHSLKAAGHWTDNSVSSQQGAFGIAAGGKFGSWTNILDVAVGGIFSQANGGESGGDTWAHAASGTYDSRWTTAINNIKTAWGSRPPGNLHLRFAHEFNGSFSSWAVNNANAANFKNAFIRFANLAHTLMPGVQVVWSPNDGTSSLTHVDDAYPGSAYVDVIGPDSYNAYPHVNTLAGWTSKTTASDSNGNPLGIEAWRLYALGKGKPLAIPEWGNPAVDTGGGAGGGDAPDYVARFIAWCKANGGFGAGQVKYACYFNIGTSGGYAADYLILTNGSNGTVHQPLTAQAIKDNA